MKKVLLNLVVLASLLILPVIAIAQEDAPEIDVMGAIENLTNWAFTILITIAVLCIILAAFYFVTAAGSSEKVNTARQWLMYALIGVAVAVAARGLITLLRKMIEV